MISLSTVALIFAGIAFIKGAALLFTPDALKRAVEAFPRSRPIAILLLILVLPWCVWELNHMPPFVSSEKLKLGVLIAAPIVFFVALYYLDELLAPRVLGGLLMLIANPMLQAAVWHDSSLRLIVTVLAYVMVIYGMVLVLSPYRFRQISAFFFKRKPILRLMGCISFLGGAGFLYLGVMVY